MKILNLKNQAKTYLLVIAITITLLLTNSPLALSVGGVLAQDSDSTGLDVTAGAAGLISKVPLATMIGQIIYVILGFLGVIFIILLIYGGFMRMTAQGDPGKVKTSMAIITSAVIGVIIILSSYIITAFVLGQISASVGDSYSGGSGGYTQCCVNPNEINQVCVPPSAAGGQGLLCPPDYYPDTRPCSEIGICP